MADEKKPTMAALAPVQSDKYAKEGEDAINASYTKLRDQLSAMPGINFEELFGQHTKSIKDKPLSPTPGRLEAFTRGFASDQGASSVMKQLDTAREEKSGKETRLLETERDLLQLKISQESQKGQADKALKTLQSQKELESRLADIKRRGDEDSFMRKQEFLFGKKGELEGTKAGYAQKLVEQKARSIAKGLGFDERMTLKLMDKVSASALLRLKAKFTFDPVVGSQFSDAEMDAAAAETEAYILDVAQQLKAEVGNQTSSPATPPAARAPAATGGKSRARIEAERIQAERNKKK